MSATGYAASPSPEIGLPDAALEFLAAMRRRFACKVYDPNRRLSEAEVDYILECGRLSPSSFGLEPWRFVAVTSAPPKEKLFHACQGQEMLLSCHLAVVILVRREEAYEPSSDFVRSRAERFPGGLPVFTDDYKGYYEFLRANGLVLHWARAQSYIACANMMTGAAAVGIDSCAVEGYREAEALDALGESSSEWAVGLIAVFGYGAEPVREKIREPMERIAERR